MPARMRLSFSPGFGLTGTSLDRIYRVGFAYEIPPVRVVVPRPQQAGGAMMRGLVLMLVMAGGLVGAQAQEVHFAGVPAKDHVRVNPFSGKTEAVTAGGALYKDRVALSAIRPMGREMARRSRRCAALRFGRRRMAIWSGSCARATCATVCRRGQTYPRRTAGRSSRICGLCSRFAEGRCSGIRAETKTEEVRYLAFASHIAGWRWGGCLRLRSPNSPGQPATGLGEGGGGAVPPLAAPPCSPAEASGPEISHAAPCRGGRGGRSLLSPRQPAPVPNCGTRVGG